MSERVREVWNAFIDCVADLWGTGKEERSCREW